MGARPIWPMPYAETQHGRHDPDRRRTSGAVRPADREPGLQAVPLPLGLRGVADPAARPLAARGSAAGRRRQGLAPQPERRRAQPADADLPLLHPGRCRGEQLLHEALRAGVQTHRGADDAVGVLQHRDGAHRRLQPPARHHRHAGARIPGLPQIQGDEGQVRLHADLHGGLASSRSPRRSRRSAPSPKGCNCSPHSPSC